MSIDLQKVPCYNSDFCKEAYNCSPTDSNYYCSIDNPRPPLTDPLDSSQNLCNYADSTIKPSRCMGANKDYCSGIVSECTVSDKYFCKAGATNPAVNFYDEKIGCDVLKDPRCLEFENFPQCQTDCWGLGGNKEVDEVCKSQFTTQSSCDSMKYFCKWNGATCRAVSEDPIKLFQAKGTQPVFSENVGDYNLKCAQSSWSSDSVTTYADGVKTCCVTGPDITGKKCVTTPRCQFVTNTCDCGFKDIKYERNPSYNEKVGGVGGGGGGAKKPLFMCSDIQQMTNINGFTSVQNGYCTWCKGSQLTNYDPKKWATDNLVFPKGGVIRENIEWGTRTDCTNRCSNYNKCEIKDSEKLWNSCMWKHSSGTIGVNPNGGDLSKGSCISSTCTQDAVNQEDINKCNEIKRISRICETELAAVVSTKNSGSAVDPNTFVPYQNSCTEGTIWNHSCSVGNNGSVVQNYACGWCPSMINETSCKPVVVAPTYWYSPLSVFGVNDEQTAISAVFLIVLFSLLLLAGCIGGIVAIVKHAV